MVKRILFAFCLVVVCTFFSARTTYAVNNVVTDASTEDNQSTTVFSDSLSIFDNLTSDLAKATSLDSFFASKTSFGPVDYAKSIAIHIGRVIALTVFVVALHTRLLELSLRRENYQNWESLQEFITFAVMFAFGYFLITRAQDIVVEIYRFLNQGGTALLNLSQPTNQGLSAAAFKDTVEGVFLPTDVVGRFFLNGLTFFSAWLISMFVHGVLAYRSIQIYLMIAFAPVGFSFFFHPQTQSWSLNYLRNFAALILANLLCLVILSLFKLAVPPAGDGLGLIKMFALYGALAAAIGASGNIAKGILGE